MPSVLESAKEAGYTAVGLNVLLFDEINERTADVRKRVDDQLDIARTHGRKAQDDLQKQADELTESIKKAMPFDVDALNDSVQDRIQPVVKRGFELAEPVWTRVADASPGPIGDMVNDGVARMRDLLIVDEPVGKKPAAKKPAAKKATKSATKKGPAKASAKKSPAKKGSAKK